MIYLASGKIKVYNRWIVAYLDNPISEYYRALLPRYLYVNPPKTRDHVTIVRPFENPDRFGWNKYDGEPVDILYYDAVRSDRRKIYYWLDADCDRIVEIRRELGLPDYLGLFECQHITVGNCKNG